MIFGILAIRLALSPKSSSAPAKISASSDFLLITEPPVLSMKSSIESNFLSLIAARIVSIGPSPSPLIALSPKRIVFPSIYVKCLRDSLTSGGSTSIHFDFASEISIRIRSISSSSDVISATIVSVG